VHQQTASTLLIPQAAASPPVSCPVTQPPSQSFVPPSPYPSQTSHDAFWYGTEKLWTRLPRNGRWNLGHYTPNDPAFRQKLFWWRQGYDWRSENPPKLTVTGKRVDYPALPLTTDEHSNAGWTDDADHAFMVTGLFIPTVGCWQVTGDYKGDKLTFVVLVGP
jgi:hypothetical protein